jgi:hypothetical protein
MYLSFLLCPKYKVFFFKNLQICSARRFLHVDFFSKIFNEFLKNSKRALWCVGTKSIFREKTAHCRFFAFRSRPVGIALCRQPRPIRSGPQISWALGQHNTKAICSQWWSFSRPRGTMPPYSKKIT